METDTPDKTIKESLVEALGESAEERSIGRPENPTLPLVGSENVQVSREEEKLYV